MRSRTALFALLAAILALIAVLTWLLTTAEAKPVDLAAEPQIHRLPLQRQRELVEVPETPPTEDEVAPTEDPDSVLEGEAGRSASADPGSARSGPGPTESSSRSAGDDPGVLVFGHVLVRGQPLEQACLEVAPAQEGLGTFRTATTSDAQGRYESHVPSGRDFLVEVTHVETVPRDPLLSRFQPQDTQRELFGRRTLSVPDVRSFREDLSFGRATIRGNVLHRWVLPDGREVLSGLSGGRVYLDATDTGPGAVARTLTDNGGDFEFEVLTPASLLVRSHRLDLWHGTTAGFGHAISAPIEVRDGEVFPVELELAGGAALEGTLAWPDSQPAPIDSLWIAYRGDRSPWFLWFGEETLRISLTGLPPGSIRVGAHPKDRGREEREARSATVELDPEEPATVDLTLRTNTKVGVRVRGVDWKTVWWSDDAGFPAAIWPTWTWKPGAPVARAEAFPSGDGPPDGLFGPLVPGKYVVHAQRGCVELERTIQVIQAREQEFRIDF